ncbi:MAG TPA: D-glycero-beta-D-manno-heptose 1-phosphate adenylyltransferase [Bacteroidia bacterium]|jgi:rfaE bifunctional protein nucleotidyltransferase chain/domain|nr:D-glycero-beta-D-manno-heptose 1-phosphate adenylyltransferase [Bacteroidia bacterium]
MSVPIPTHLDIIQKRIFTAERLAPQLLTWRFHSQKIVFTNGCFDILHRGHIDYLSKAADCGNILIIGLNSDASTKKLNKGASRPIQDETSRALILASLHFVSAVVLFDEDTPYELIKLIQPDVLVKGADYKIEQIAGHDIVQAKGGEVKLIPFLEGFSTSGIEQKIKKG